MDTREARAAEQSGAKAGPALIARGRYCHLSQGPHRVHLTPHRPRYQSTLLHRSRVRSTSSCSSKVLDNWFAQNKALAAHADDGWKLGSFSSDLAYAFCGRQGERRAITIEADDPMRSGSQPV